MGYGANGAGGVIPGGATLNFDVEVVSVGGAEGDMDFDEGDMPNIFAKLDTDRSGDLSLEEIEAHFKELGEKMPEHLMEEEDKDKDGKVSWEEFSGPKARTPSAPSTPASASHAPRTGRLAARGGAVGAHARRLHSNRRVPRAATPCLHHCE